MGFLDKLKKKSSDEAHAQDAAVSGTPTSALSTLPRETATPVRGVGAGTSVLVKAILSEKATSAESRGTYTFLVGRDVTKPMVKAAVKAVYGVTPTAVRIANAQGKWVRFGRGYGRRKDTKKAMVTLPKGKTIRIHEGV